MKNSTDASRLLFDQELAKRKIQSEQLRQFIVGEAVVYVDYANVRGTYQKRRWNVDIKRLKWFLDTFSSIKHCNFYYGTLQSESQAQESGKLTIVELAKKCGYVVHTKPVKEMHIPFDATSIPLQSPALVSRFVSRSLYKHFSIVDIETMNKIFLKLHSGGLSHLVDKKCNFDVEMGMHMLQDLEHGVSTFVIMSSDSDFEYPVKQIIQRGKRVVLLTTRGTLARELQELAREQSEQVHIQYINQYRNIVCFENEQKK